jgi:hypothetical protein
MEDVYRAFGFDEKEAWEMALKSLCYRVEDFILCCHEVVSADEEIGGVAHFPVLTVDDAGVGFSHLKRFSEEAKKLKGIFDTIGDVINGIIYTTPNPSGLLNFIRADPTFRIEIRPNPKGPEWRIAKGFKQQILVDGNIAYTEDGAPLDSYKVILEDWRYQSYQKIRRSYSRDAIKEAYEVVIEKKEREKMAKALKKAKLRKGEVLPCPYCGEETDTYWEGEDEEGNPIRVCEECYESILKR